MATSITLTTNSASTEYTLATGGRGPVGPSPTVVDAVTNGDANAVSSNAVFDALALKAPLISPTFTDDITVQPPGFFVQSITLAPNPSTGFLHYATPQGGHIRFKATYADVTVTNEYTFPDATGTIALTSDITGTNSGTNTGDETAARIATALNAGTQDTVAADTDKLAVTHPAGGWMLLSTLWTWITGKIDTLAKLDAIVADATLARTDAGQTFAGAQAFSGPVQLAAGQAATDAQSAMSRGLGDTRYASSANVFTSVDTVNGAANALYVLPALAGQRIFMGSAAKAPYSVNFANVSFIESFPSSLTMLGGTENGLSRSVITATGDLILDNGGGTGTSWISSRNAPTTTRRSLAFIFRGLDTDSYKRVAGFIHSAVATAATWTLPHTRWSCNTDATTLMELSMAGALNVGSNITAGNFKRGAGSPESVIIGSVGDIYTRTDGGAGTTLYVKESGAATNTGWVAK